MMFNFNSVRATLYSLGLLMLPCQQVLGDTSKVEPSKVEPSKVEPSKVEPSKVEAVARHWQFGFGLDGLDGLVGGSLSISRNVTGDNDPSSMRNFARVGLRYGVHGLRYREDSAKVQQNTVEYSAYFENIGLILPPISKFSMISVKLEDWKLNNRLGYGTVNLPKDASRDSFGFLFFEEGLAEMAQAGGFEIGVGIRRNFINEPVTAGSDKFNREIQFYQYVRLMF